MQSLKSLAEAQIYEDSPYFSDQLLLPAVAAGHKVNLVTAFNPSYLARLINDLATSPEIEPGKVHVIFCIPFQLAEDLGYGRLLSKYLSAFAGSSAEVKTFLNSALKLIAEGGLTLGALFSPENRQLTPSCVGVIESGEKGSSEYLSLIDGTAGDLNSPITISSSWDKDTGDLKGLTDLVVRAKNERFSNLMRLSHGEVVELLREILQRGYPRVDLAERDALVPSGKRKRSSTPGKTKVSRARVASDESEDDVEIDEILGDFETQSGFGPREIDRIIAEISMRESAYADGGLDEFLGIPLDIEIDYDNPNKKRHAGPMPVYLAEMVGYGYDVCWCGADYDRSAGCPDYIY